jgi:hypothetical protein
MTFAALASLLQERACYALDTFCEGLEAEDLAPYMSQVRGRCQQATLLQ